MKEKEEKVGQPEENIGPIQKKKTRALPWRRHANVTFQLA